MNKDDIPNNSIVFGVEILDDEEVSISTGHKFDLKMDDESVDYWTSVLLGISHLFTFNPEFLRSHGDLLKYMSSLEDDDDEDDIVFEPSDELREAIEENKKNSKVVNIKSRMN